MSKDSALVAVKLPRKNNSTPRYCDIRVVGPCDAQGQQDSDGTYTLFIMEDRMGHVCQFPIPLKRAQRAHGELSRLLAEIADGDF